MRHQAPSPSPERQLCHELQVRCASDVGALIRVLNCYAVMRAKVLSAQCDANIGEMRIAVISAGLSDVQAHTLRCRVASLEGVETVSIAAMDADQLSLGAAHV
ncbi:MAG: hypothetical protein M0D54_10045 [Hyphomonadaceae bacterium JAD_PAG50586_4]|nr:MAG: hypothetical protein M0D54_10045 [Hyphomonadaceae bacterium JAD_PAG50586_4]